ncbi:MAG: segregation/condensation protein A [Clostridiales bacterium]|nr:segregation/condensation protein A [Clostridiales bacterium]
MAYVVNLRQFDGPLDLLLALISRAKLDICDIFVSEITEQYLSAMAGVDELDMDAASEFLQMAATLLEIKSRALLPVPPPEPAEDEESPEQALIRQLMEYKAYKEASGDLRRLEEAARALYGKLPEEFPLPPPEFELTGLTLKRLQLAFMRALSRLPAEDAAPRERELRREAYTVSACMFRIQSALRAGDTTFDRLLPGRTCREEIVAMFMALLELMRLGRVALLQDSPYAELRICNSQRSRG